MRAQHNCWECGERAPAGVCTRPHPDGNLRDAIDRGHIEMSIHLEVGYHPVLCACGKVSNGPAGHTSHMAAHGRRGELAVVWRP